MRWLAYILSALLLVDTAQSQVIDGVEIVKPRIITGDWDPVTKRFPIAIEFAIAPKWHLYWLNPGDAGSPPKVTWVLPEGWKANGLQFPVPVKEEEDGMVAYAYYDTLVLIDEIYSPVKPTNEPLQATIKWMVCKDICVPGELKISGSYQSLKTKFDWPKLPLVPTLLQAGFEWFIKKPNVIEKGFSGFRHEILVIDPSRVRVFIDQLYPYVDSPLPIDLRIEDGMIVHRVHEKTPSPQVELINGLVFIDDKVYWLKQP